MAETEPPKEIMKLYLVRQTDDQPVAEKVARHLKGCEVKPVVIWRAPGPAASKTAEVLGKIVGEGAVVERSELKDVGSVSLAPKLGDVRRDLMLVADQPLLHKLTAELIKHPTPGAFLSIPMGGIWLLTYNEPGVWKFYGTVAPELARA